MMDTPNPTTQTADRLNSVRGASIRMRGITKFFGLPQDGHHALGPIDIAIQAGEFVSIIGPSGCGKSTTMLIAAGLIPPSDGKVEIDGRALTRPLTDVGIELASHEALVQVRVAERARNVACVRERADERHCVFCAERIECGEAVAIRRRHCGLLGLGAFGPTQSIPAPRPGWRRCMMSRCGWVLVAAPGSAVRRQSDSGRRNACRGSLAVPSDAGSGPCELQRRAASGRRGRRPRPTG